MYPVSETTPVLGIAVCERNKTPPFAESRYIRRLMAKAAAMGLDVFPFAPWTWDERSGTVKGWQWNDREQSWQSYVRKLPAVVYDRSWPDNETERHRFRAALYRLTAEKKLTLLNGRLPNKAEVHALLSRDAELSPLLPETEVYQDASTLASWLARHVNGVFLKPVDGSQGRRTLSVTRSSDGTVLLQGRTAHNRSFRLLCPEQPTALERLHKWIGKRTYIMQPTLDLRGLAGEPFDLRALMQKNGRGHWVTTGIAARCGAPGTVTANLHGGGHAAPGNEVLSALFGEAHSADLMQDIQKFGLMMVNRLEQNFGRFAEIGLDFGVDRAGRLWFLEANSKPGRGAMHCAGGEAAAQAETLPLLYARSILLRPPGRVIHEFDHL
ncbi:hypothetical protein SD71_05935 [Cohnella kolymensis]|uniref:ATP-grasp domain-containing protein n=1 Tax=Cohnella kolymensis TaxID=1590652 RepID=A0ABR5A6T8_9BACL|nr:hypothetical protein SD71_05935 [Cohnella kolymensis]